MKKQVPYSHQSIDSKDIAAVTKVLLSDFITQGPKIQEFEQALCGYTGCRYAVCVSSGTAALHIACLAAGISKGDEVITSPLTFAASVNCVLYCGAKPVFADVETDTANMDVRQIERKITRKTKAIIPVHFAGHPCELDTIAGLSRKHNLIVIEDGAHALGAAYKGIPIGRCKHSHMTILSFHPVKAITTGEGGAVLTNGPDLYRRLLLFRNHGITKDKARLIQNEGPWYYEMQELGFNYRITDLQCALGLSQLGRVDKFISKRRKVAQAYTKAFQEIIQLQLPVERPHVRSAWHLFPLRIKSQSSLVEKRLKIFEFLRGKGIGVQVHYIPVYWHPYYRASGYKKGLCPEAECFYHSEISIPLYLGMSKREIDRVIRMVILAFKKI